MYYIIVNIFIFLHKYYCFIREKMAFFTRPGVSVPVPPSKSSRDSKSAETRYQYTVDRVYGVEV